MKSSEVVTKTVVYHLLSWSPVLRPELGHRKGIPMTFGKRLELRQPLPIGCR